MWPWPRLFSTSVSLFAKEDRNAFLTGLTCGLNEQINKDTQVINRRVGTWRGAWRRKKAEPERDRGRSGHRAGRHTWRLGNLRWFLGTQSPHPGVCLQNTHTHATSCGDSPSVFSILVRFLFSEYSLLGDTVLRTSRLILCNLQDSPERQIGAKAERS